MEVNFLAGAREGAHLLRGSRPEAVETAPRAVSPHGGGPRIWRWGSEPSVAGAPSVLQTASGCL